jgi:hypothetical protein
MAPISHPSTSFDPEFCRQTGLPKKRASVCVRRKRTANPARGVWPGQRRPLPATPPWRLSCFRSKLISMNHAFLRASFVACSVILAFGQSRPLVSFQATTQTVDGSTLRPTGNVQIGTAQRSIQADAVDYNVTTGEIRASGNVLVTEHEASFRADMVKGHLVVVDHPWRVKDPRPAVPADPKHHR